jgi:hypothetical protein
MEVIVNAIVLTRTSNRPKMFGRLREALRLQEFDGRIYHAVYSDDPSDDYIEGDFIVRGKRLPKGGRNSFPWELYNLYLMIKVQESRIPGFIIFIDDDDIPNGKNAIQTIVSNAEHDSILLWKVERENGRISPFVWENDLNSKDGRVCWEAGTFHTRHLAKALEVGVDDRDGADGRFWYRLSQRLPVKWLDKVLMKPQVGKGHGRRNDE